MKINHLFDSGNIEVFKIESFDNIQLCIRSDENCEFSQWFHYRVSGANNQPLVMKLINAGSTSYAKGWHDYQALASYRSTRPIYELSRVHRASISGAALVSAVLVHSALVRVIMLGAALA